MPTSTPLKIECDEANSGIVVPDILAAVNFYTERLGFTLGFTWGDPPTFAGVNLDKVRTFFRKGAPDPNGSFTSYLVGDADSLYAFHRSQGVEIAVEIGDRDYGLRDYSVRDLNGYFLSFGHHIYSVGPRVKIERVDVPVRLEKRLAALLQELAQAKRMSVSSCLEEILLHTNDGVGPHTPAQLRRIQELKIKHGIDYDTHASYLFTEEK